MFYQAFGEYLPCFCKIITHIWIKTRVKTGTALVLDQHSECYNLYFWNFIDIRGKGRPDDVHEVTHLKVLGINFAVGNPLESSKAILTTD